MPPAFLSQILALTTVALFACGSAQAETLVERGAYLVTGIGACGNCHSPQHPDGTLAGPALSGGMALIQPGFTAYPPNLTPDGPTGLGNWSEDQIVVALREGRTPSGQLLRPPMPILLYRGLSDHDAHAIAAYLRSLAPVRNAVPVSVYTRSMPTTYGGPVSGVAEPDRRDHVAYGHYLAQLGHCMECHTPRDADGHPDNAHRLGGGGLVLHGVFGDVVSANITPDPVVGIGGWTDQQIKDALSRGTTPDGLLLPSPMPWRYLATMRSQDLDALVAYLRTLKPVAD
jgi:mono/diheme cytochrome c family protein